MGGGDVYRLTPHWGGGGGGGITNKGAEIIIMTSTFPQAYPDEWEKAIGLKSTKVLQFSLCLILHK